MNRCLAILVPIVLGATVIACGGASSNEKVDAGQRRYCPGSLVDAGCDASVGQGGAPGGGGEAGVVVDGSVGVPDLGAKLEVGQLDLRSALTGEVGGFDGGVAGDGGGAAPIDAPGGGGLGAGGVTATGGVVASGGSTTTGGATASGGTAGSGGSTATGGATASGGTAGTGGSTVTGGATGSGGTAGSGGSTATGGAVGSACLGPSWAAESTPELAAMTSAASGTLWTAGAIYGSFNFGAGTITSTGSSDAYLNMVSSTTGAATKSFAFGDPGANEQTASLVAAGQNGNVLVAGLYVNEIDFTSNGDNGNLNLDYLGEQSKSAGAPMNYWVVASASSTMPYITPIYAHDTDLGDGAFLAAASNPAINKAAICGKTMRAVGLSTTKTGFLSNTTAFSGQTDVVVGVIDLATTGEVVWGAQFGGTGNSQCTAVAMDANGNTYIAGNYNGSLSFTSVTSGGKTIALPTVSTSDSLALMFVAEFDPNGNAVAAQSWGSSGISNVNGIAVDGSGNVIIAGGIAQADANFGAPVGTLTSLGLLNGFVVKLNNALTTPAWGFTFGDATFNQQVLSVATSSTGDVFVGGAYEGSLGAKLDNLTSTSDTASSAFDAQLAAATGAVECAHSYGDASGNHGMNVVNVATAATGSLANAVTYGGNFAGTMTLGATTLSTLTSADTYGYVTRVVPQ